MMAMISHSPSQYLESSTAVSATKFFVTLTSQNAVGRIFVSPASSIGSKRKQRAHTATATTSTTRSMKNENVKLMSLKSNVPSIKWAVSGWESSAVYRPTSKTVDT